MHRYISNTLTLKLFDDISMFSIISIHESKTSQSRGYCSFRAWSSDSQCNIINTRHKPEENDSFICSGELVFLMILTSFLHINEWFCKVTTTNYTCTTNRGFRTNLWYLRYIGISDTIVLHWILEICNLSTPVLWQNVVLFPYSWCTTPFEIIHLCDLVASYGISNAIVNIIAHKWAPWYTPCIPLDTMK